MTATPISQVPAEPLEAHVRVADDDYTEWVRGLRTGRWYALDGSGSSLTWPDLVHHYPTAMVRGRLQPATDDIGVPATHSTGPGTEAVSAALMRPRAGTLRAKALAALLAAEPHGLTDTELAAATETYLYSIAPRRAELARMGWVMDSGERRTSDRNRPAVVWVLTGPAVEELILHG